MNYLTKTPVLQLKGSNLPLALYLLNEQFVRERMCWDTRATDSIIRELTNLGRTRRPRLHKTKTAITEITAVQLCRKHNLKDLLFE